jgi:hypothetical protein
VSDQQTPPHMAVEWERGERIGFMPPDSGIVYPPLTMVVEWRPLTTATIIDHDPGDVPVAAE